MLFIVVSLALSISLMALITNYINKQPKELKQHRTGIYN